MADNKFELDPGPEWPPLHVTIVDPDPSWAPRFELEAALLRGALGSRLIEIHHFGSTAVPGLAAKPIVDIAIVVEGEPADLALEPLRAIGYVHRRRTHRDDLLFLGKGDGHEVHLQVFGVGNPEVRRLLRLRDYLRSHPEESQRYADLKRALADKHAGAVRYYARDKFFELQELNARAERWDTERLPS